MNADEIIAINKIIEKFILNPENFVLYRGQTIEDNGGLHFALDKDWAKKFGNIIIKGTLPVGSKIKPLKEADFQEAFSLGLPSERPVWDLIFSKGYDAIIATDSMESSKLDVIVNPKHLERFKLSSNSL